MFPRIVGTLEQAMKAANLRHQVIANNVANVNVPGFHGQEVSFEESLKEAIAGQPEGSDQLQGLVADPRHIPIGSHTEIPQRVEPTVQMTNSGAMRQDGNTVDMEVEMARLAANQLWYQALVRSVSDEFSRLRTAINEGRR
jgi:flagellar basal-body rod protein FlgB